MRLSVESKAPVGNPTQNTQSLRNVGDVFVENWNE